MSQLISIIVATFNRPDLLNAVLRGLSKQSDQSFEIVVADDGSGPETARVIERWQARWHGRLIQIWQPDDGFRLAEARNRAVSAASSDYLVFLDGDCIPRPDFVAAHRRLAEPGWLVCGHRLMAVGRLHRSGGSGTAADRGLGPRPVDERAQPRFDRSVDAALAAARNRVETPPDPEQANSSLAQPGRRFI